MNLYLLIMMLLSNSANTSSPPNQYAFRHTSIIQNASNPYKGKVIAVVGVFGLEGISPIEVIGMFREKHIDLMGSLYSSKLVNTARKALLKWLKEKGYPKAKVDVSISPTRNQEAKEIDLTFKVTGVKVQRM